MTDTSIDLSGQIPLLAPNDDFKGGHIQRLFQIPSQIPDLKQYVIQQSRNVRPWLEFVNTSNFKTPLNVPRLIKRIKKNVTYFYGNYLYISLGLIIYCLITSPLILLTLVGSLYASHRIKKLSEHKKLTLAGLELTQNQQYALVALISMPIFYLVGVHGAIFWVLGASLCFVSIHAAFYNIEALNVDSSDTENLFENV